MASTSPPLAMPFALGSGSLMGQGKFPEAQVFYTTSDQATSLPVWTQAHLGGTGYVRAFSSQRGRGTERDRVDAGTATITLDNRDRTFDPTNNPAIKPGNRWWIRSLFNGTTEDVFKGAAESYQLRWAGGPYEATAVVQVADELKALQQNRLPAIPSSVTAFGRGTPAEGFKVAETTAATYAEMIAMDNPANYWTFSDGTLSGSPGPAWTVGTSGGYGLANASGVLGDWIGDGETFSSGSLFMSGPTLASVTTDQDSSFDTQAGSVMTCEFWFRYSAVPGANFQFLGGRTNAAGASRNFVFNLLTTGQVTFQPVNTTPSVFTTTSAALTANTWYHVAGVVTGSNTILYINGVAVDTQSFSGTLVTHENDLSTTLPPHISNGQSMNFNIDELAFYPRALSASRILGHYTAGAQRGFPNDQAPGDRANAILDAAGSHAPRSIQTGVRTMTPAFMHHQPVLDELRTLELAENVDAFLFVTRDGTIKFLAAAHRASSPYNTVQAVFDDDGTDLRYAPDLVLDVSDAFVFNEWTVTRRNGSQQLASDLASQSAYGYRPSAAIGDVPVNTNAQASTIATALLAKYKDAFSRVPAITILAGGDPDTTAAALARDIGDRIQVIRRPPGGGTAIDQTLFIQSISVDADSGPVMRITFVVSPL